MEGSTMTGKVEQLVWRCFCFLLPPPAGRTWHWNTVGRYVGSVTFYNIEIPTFSLKQLQCNDTLFSSLARVITCSEHLDLHFSFTSGILQYGIMQTSNKWRAASCYRDSISLLDFLNVFSACRLQRSTRGPLETTTPSQPGAWSLWPPSTLRSARRNIQVITETREASKPCQPTNTLNEWTHCATLPGNQSDRLCCGDIQWQQCWT